MIETHFFCVSIIKEFILTISESWSWLQSCSRYDEDWTNRSFERQIKCKSSCGPKIRIFPKPNEQNSLAPTHWRSENMSPSGNCSSQANFWLLGRWQYCCTLELLLLLSHSVRNNKKLIMKKFIHSIICDHDATVL